MHLRLVEPSLEYVASFERLRDACLRDGYHDWEGRHVLALSDVPSWIELVKRRARGEDLPEGWVPETSFWVISNRDVVGTMSLRHPLNDNLRNVGGNVGYLTHPRHRRNGVATFALREGLRILATWGLAEALVTCNDDNIASIRTIERAGGRRIEDAQYPGPKRRRYMIPTVE